MGKRRGKRTVEDAGHRRTVEDAGPYSAWWSRLPCGLGGKAKTVCFAGGETPPLQCMMCTFVLRFRWKITNRLLFGRFVNRPYRVWWYPLPCGLGGIIVERKSTNKKSPLPSSFLKGGRACRKRCRVCLWLCQNANVEGGETFFQKSFSPSCIFN